MEEVIEDSRLGKFPKLKMLSPKDQQKKKYPENHLKEDDVLRNIYYMIFKLTNFS